MEGEIGVTAAEASIRRLSFNSIDQAEAEIQLSGVDQRMRQIGTRSFQASISSACVDSVELISERYEADISLSCSPPEKFIGVIFTGSGTGHRLINGRGADDVGLVYLPPGGESDFVSQGCFGAESIIIPEDRFNQTLAAVAPKSDFLNTANLVMANRDRAEGLRRQIVALLNQSMPDPERIAELVEATILYLTDSRCGVSSSRPDPTSGRRIAKQAQDFIEARYMSPIRIEDICRYCGVGVRTLQRAFRDYFGYTISEQIKSIRLDQAFRTLKAAVPADSTVAEIAQGSGFTHLGRFSVMYRERFGESPNSTLRSV
jgi:AraC-like DNA-binding protein